MFDIADNFLGHPLHRQDEVHQAGIDGAPGHERVFGLFLGLGHGHAAPALDRLQPQRAVAAGAGEHDADGLLFQVLGQGAEKVIDGQAHVPDLDRLHQMKHSLIECHFSVRRIEIDGIGLHLHAVPDLQDGHVGIFFEDFADNALVLGAEVLDDHKSHVHARRAGMLAKKASRGSRPPADAPMPTTGKIFVVSFFAASKFSGPGSSRGCSARAWPPASGDGIAWLSAPVLRFGSFACRSQRLQLVHVPPLLPW